ncbi:hypothetical protein Tco_1207962, partial [Tanacetum coccineum]
SSASHKQFPSNMTLEAEFNVESSHLEIGTRVFIFPRCKTKRITYVNMKFSRFKKLGLGFLYLGNDDLLETDEISYSARIRVKEVWNAHSLS